LLQFQGVEEKGKNGFPEGRIGNVLAFLRKPSTFIIIVLVCMITVLSL